MFDQLQKLDEEIEKLYENLNSKEGDVTDIHNEIERLKKEKDLIYEQMAEVAAEAITKKENAFRERSYFGSDVETLLEHVASGKVDCLNTDDFQYGKWQEEVPEGWDLDRYFDTMRALQDVFNHLGYFQTDVSDYFQEQQLYIRWKNSVILTLDFIVGQGSDFSIILKSRRKFPEPKFILNWEDAVELSKKGSYSQAIWYIKNVLMDAKTFEEDLSGVDLSVLTFILGKSSYFGNLTKENWKEEINSWRKD